MVYGRRRIGRKRAMRKRTSVRKTPFKRYNAGRLVSKAKTRDLVKLIKGVQLKTCETCYKTTKFSQGPVPVGQNYMTGYVNHNTISSFSLWYQDSAAFPNQGLTDGERRGDEIHLIGIKFRCVMQIPWDRRNSRFRFYYVPWNTNQGDPASKSNLFHGTINNVMVDAMQTDRYKIKFLGSARCSSVDQTGASQDAEDKTIIRSFWIPFKKKITFINDGSRTVAKGLPEEGRILVTGYDSITSLETDTICPYIEASMTLYYKDP